MRQRSKEWIKLAQSGCFLFEAKACIGTAEYTSISAPLIDRTLMSTPLTVGNCVSATLNLSILTEDNIPPSAPVTILGRLTDGKTNSEWMKFGTFYINQRNTDHSGLVTLNCYDAMLKTNQLYLNGSNTDTTWPKPMTSVVEEIALRIGVTVDPRTKLHTGDNYTVPEPHDLTMMQVLGYIGACHGGNWIITEENALRLIPLRSAMQAPTVADTSDESSTRIIAVLGQLTNDATVTVTGVEMSDSAGNRYTAGTKHGAVISIDRNPYACQEICDTLYGQLAGLVYAPFTALKAFYDPASELGDRISIGNRVHGILYNSKMTLDLGFRADISAPTAEALSEEYPHLSKTKEFQQTTDRLKQRITELKEETTKEITTRQQAVLDLNQVMTNSLGLYGTSETLNDGSVIHYLHNQSTLEASTAIYTQNANGYAWTVGENCWNNGSPVWQYGYTKEGNAVFNFLSVNDVNVSGCVTAKSGSIGRWEINGDGISKVCESGTDRYYVFMSGNMYTPENGNPYNPVFGVHELNSDDWKFYVRSNGELFAKNATIYGKITSVGDGDKGTLTIDNGGINIEYGTYGVHHSGWKTSIGSAGINICGDYTTYNASSLYMYDNTIVFSYAYHQDSGWINMVSGPKIYHNGSGTAKFSGTWVDSGGTSISSDENEKNSIELLDERYDTFFDLLSSHRFKYNHGTSNRYHTGYITQEVQKALKIAGLSESEFAGVITFDNGTEAKDIGTQYSSALRYHEFVALNTFQIQKLKKRVFELETLVKKHQIGG